MLLFLKGSDYERKRETGKKRKSVGSGTGKNLVESMQVGELEVTKVALSVPFALEAPSIGWGKKKKKLTES